MIPVVTGLAGIVAGIVSARRRGGNRLDQVHHAAAFGIAFALAGMFVAVLIDRMV